MRRTVIGWTAAMAALIAVGMGIGALGGPGLPAGASSGPDYPVVWSFLPTATIAAAENGPDVAPPGANLPCTPTTEHPYPVILVHGLAADQNDNWQAMSPFLANNGYCVYSLTYGNMASAPRPFNEMGALTDMAASAGQLAAFVNQVLAQTGAPKVDIVGHSEGGTMPDYYLKFGGGSKVVDHFVMLSGLPHGTTFWGLSDLYDQGAAYGFSSEVDALFAPFCAACTEFLVGSPFMQNLDAPNAQSTATEAATCPYDGAAVDGVNYTSIATKLDELVRPYTSDFIDPRCGEPTYGIGVDNIVVQQQCPLDLADHVDISADPVTAQDVLNALDPEHQQAVRCVVVLPAVG